MIERANDRIRYLSFFLLFFAFSSIPGGDDGLLILVV